MKWRHIVPAALLSALVSMPASGQQVTRFVTGSSPGSGVDTLTRILAEAMAPLLNRNIIVENKPGASYNIAADHVAKAAADGNTVLVTFNAHPLAGALTQVSYDPVKDFRAIGFIGTTPYLIVSNPQVPGQDLKELLALANQEKRALNFGSIGNGTPQHLMLERLKAQTASDILMVHYKSASSAMTDTIAGHVDFSLLTISTAADQVRNGRLKALAVTSAERLPDFPDVATINELGYKDFITDGWYAMLLPAQASDAVVQEFNQALNQALAQPGVQQRIESVGAAPLSGTPEEVDQRIREDAVMWRKVIKDHDIRPE